MRVAELTVELVIQEINAGKIGWVRQIPGSRKVEPPEIWLEELAVWVRVGSDCAIAPASHYWGQTSWIYPGWFDRWRIRRAVKRRGHFL
jgi:hypothetical protein